MKDQTAKKVQPKADEPKKAQVIDLDVARKKVETAQKSLETLKANKKANGDPNGTYDRSIKAAKSRLKNAKSDLHKAQKNAGELFYQKHSKKLYAAGAVAFVAAASIIFYTILGNDDENGESDTDTV